MPTITIDGKLMEFEQGQSILDVATENEIEIPQYCYHPSLSVVASCRICLAEVWGPNPRNNNKLEQIDSNEPSSDVINTEVSTSSLRLCLSQVELQKGLTRTGQSSMLAI